MVSRDGAHDLRDAGTGRARQQTGSKTDIYVLLLTGCDIVISIWIVEGF